MHLNRENEDHTLRVSLHHHGSPKECSIGLDTAGEVDRAQLESSETYREA